MSLLKIRKVYLEKFLIKYKEQKVHSSKPSISIFLKIFVGELIQSAQLTVSIFRQQLTYENNSLKIGSKFPCDMKYQLKYGKKVIIFAYKYSRINNVSSD